jgi:2'-5' RNA ligase
VNKTYRTAAVLVPPETVWESIQRIRKQHDRHYRRWMPHITLLYPFLPQEMWPDVLEALRQACLRIQPFAVELSRFDRFVHRSSCTLWLAPTPVEALVELQTALWQVVPDCDDTRRHNAGFSPHLSVGQTRDKGSTLARELQAEWNPVRFLAHEVQLIWRNDPPDDVFRMGETLLLGTESLNTQPT